MLEINFDLFLAIIVGSLIFMLGSRIMAQNPRSFTNRVFFVHSLVIAFWSLANYYSLLSSLADALFWIRFVIILAVPHVFLSLIFIKNFPHEELTFPRRTYYLLLILMATMMGVAASPYVFRQVTLIDAKVVPLVGPLMSGFGPVLVIFVLATFYIIVRKYRQSTGLARKQWAVMGSGFFISYLLLITFVFLATVLFNNTAFVPLSPLFVLPIFAFSAYAILRYRLFEIKVIATELLTASIWIFLLLQTLLAKNWAERIQDGVLFLILVVLGIFLIRSVSAEVRQREQMQNLTGQLRQTNTDLLLRNRYLAALQALTSEITRSLNFSKFSQEIVDGVTEKLDFIGGILFLLDSDKKNFKVSAVTNSQAVNKALKFLPPQFKDFQGSFGDDNTLTVLAMRSGRPQVGAELANFVSPPIPRGIAAILQNALRARSFVAVPIFSEDAVLGCLLTASRLPREKLNDTTVQMVKALADEIGIMARNLKLYEQLGRTNAELQSANRQLSRLDKAKTEFLSIASHQLRTPLTAIKGYVSMILDGDYGKLPPKFSEPMRDVFESAERLIGLVNDLLDVSRIASGRLELHLQPVDISKLTANIIAEIKPKAEGKRLAFFVQDKMPVDAPIKADEEKLRQVIINLIDNAIKYTNQGSVTVLFEKDGPNMKFTVADTGLGIAREELEQLFHRFMRTKEAKLVETEGTGLGLYVAKTIIEAMAGRIWVESEGLGHGSRFIFELPFAPSGFKEELINVASRQDYIAN